MAIWTQVKQLAAQTPEERNRYVDFLRAVSITVVIVGHSNTVPDLVNRFGGVARMIDESEYGALFKLVVKADGISTTESQIDP